MDHKLGQRVFAEIQSRPYRLSTEIGVPVNNCYFKGLELIQKLGGLGYTVRGRMGETYWDPKLFPPEILALKPEENPEIHFFVEIQENGVWRTLDPSFHPGMARHGFPIGGWFSGSCCFPMTKIYTQEESHAYQKTWEKRGVVEQYMAKNARFHHALNQWIASLTVGVYFIMDCL